MYRIIYGHDIEIFHFITTTKVTVNVWNVILYAKVEIFVCANSFFFCQTRNLIRLKISMSA